MFVNRFIKLTTYLDSDAHTLTFFTIKLQQGTHDFDSYIRSSIYMGSGGVPALPAVTMPHITAESLETWEV